MSDLLELNEAIIIHSGKKCYQQFYQTQFCVGRFIPSADDLLNVAAGVFRQDAVSSAGGNPPETLAINEKYLFFARLVSKDICNGDYEGLVSLEIGMQQAKILASMTNKQIKFLANTWPGEIFSVEMLDMPVESICKKIQPHYAVIAAMSRGGNE